MYPVHGPVQLREVQQEQGSTFNLNVALDARRKAEPRTVIVPSLSSDPQRKEEVGQAREFLLDRKTPSSVFVRCIVIIRYRILPKKQAYVLRNGLLALICSVAHSIRAHLIPASRFDTDSTDPGHVWINDGGCGSGFLVQAAKAMHRVCCASRVFASFQSPVPARMDPWGVRLASQRSMRGGGQLTLQRTICKSSNGRPSLVNTGRRPFTP